MKGRTVGIIVLVAVVLLVIGYHIAVSLLQVSRMM